MKELKNGRSELFHMNGEALKNLITAAGYSCKSLSEKMEFNGNYLSKCIRQNKIGQVAVQKLMEYNIKPAMYQVENFDILKKKIERLKEAREIERLGGLDEAERRFNEKLHDFEVNNKKYDRAIMEEIVKRNSGRYPWGEEKSPAEQAMEEPGVVKLEFTIDIVKLKAIVKQAVKEAYEEL